MTMSEGLPHPSAHKKTIECGVTGNINLLRGVSLSITSQRLASVVHDRDQRDFQLRVWDWITGDPLFVCYFPAYRVQNPGQSSASGVS